MIKAITTIKSKVVVLIAGKTSGLKVVVAGVVVVADGIFIVGGTVDAGALAAAVVAAAVLAGVVAVTGMMHLIVPSVWSWEKELVTSIVAIRTLTLAEVTCPTTL